MTSFSERIGEKEPKEIQIKGMDDGLQNSLWNCLKTHIFDHFKDFKFPDATEELMGRSPPNHGYYFMIEISKKIWSDYFKEPLDDMGESRYSIITSLREKYFGSYWTDAYEFVEFIINNCPEKINTKKLIEDINLVLKRELSGYRVVSSVFTPITSEIEIKEIEEAGNRSSKEVQAQLKSALKLIANKESPDYRNSIKESISAVGTMCKQITGKPNATLSDALKELKKRSSEAYHPVLITAFEKLYSYTCDEKAGIRHEMMEEKTLKQEDALFMLVACSAFINYLVSKST